MIVEQVGKIGFLAHQPLALGAIDEGARIGHEALARQRFEDVEHLFGIFLVGDQLAEMAERLERAECRRDAARI